jgi:hypothetical protein
VNGTTGAIESVDIKEDTGSTVNWISPKTAEELMIPTREVKGRVEIVGMMKSMTFTPTRGAEVSLIGTSAKSLHAECFIAPDDFPVHAIVLVLSRKAVIPTSIFP